MKVELQLNCTGGWVDYSSSTDLSRFTRELSLDNTNDPQKRVTGTVNFFGTAYSVVYGHLISSPNMYSNSVCIRVTDNTCTGYVYLFKIDNKNLKWCDDEGCEMQFDMVGIEPELDCIRNTPISDNTNHVFDQFGPIVHPRFRYCDVFKPTLVFFFVMGAVSALDLLITFYQNLIATLNSLLGLGLPIPPLLGSLLAGCELGWPAPFVRTYVDNVCTLCGITADAVTAPILYSTTNPFVPAESNQYYNMTLLTAYAKKGVPMNGTQSYIPNNAPSWTLRRLLSNLKPVFNARWFFWNGKIYFHRKDLLGNLVWGTTPVLDFTTDADKKNILEGVCYEWNGEGKNKRVFITYANDSTDAIGNETRNRYNGEYIDPSGNPNYTEAQDTEVNEYGATSFVLDGNDTAYDSVLLNSIAGILGTTFPGCLKTTTDTNTLAKLIIYDSSTPIADARSVKDSMTNYISFPQFQDEDTQAGVIVTSQTSFYNYPMSFSPQAAGIKNNLWLYHYIDMPQPNKKTNIAFQFKLNYCCQYSTLNLYQKVKMKDGSIGEIDYVQFDHETRTITVRGNLL